MSKKTDAIYDTLRKLDEYQNSLSNYVTTCSNEEVRALSDIEFGLKQELRTLRFWIDSLYKYNGKSTSILKKSASKENGKKGGRPPKDVTLARRRIKEIENELLPQLEKDMMMADSNEALKENEEEIQKLKIEKEECENKVFEYKREKDLKSAIERL